MGYRILWGHLCISLAALSSACGKSTSDGPGSDQAPTTPVKQPDAGRGAKTPANLPKKTQPGAAELPDAATGGSPNAAPKNTECTSGDTQPCEPEQCVGERVCEQGVWGECVCRPRVCQASEFRCAEQTLQICKEDASGWTDVESCAEGSNCDATLRGCDGTACKVGAFRCAGTLLQECRKDGSVWDDVEACRSSAVCDARTGECRPKVCTEGEVRCLGSLLQKCSNDLTAFEDADQCAVGEVCHATMGQCVPGAGIVEIDLIAGTTNDYGFALKDSFFIVPCYQAQEHDCLTVPLGCPNQDKDDPELTGRVFTELFKLDGTPGSFYDITLQVNGIVSPKLYKNGTRRAGNSWPVEDTGEGRDMLYVGGAMLKSSYDVFKLSVFPGDYDPFDKGVPLQHFYLNSVPSETGAETRQTFPISYSFTMEDVPGDAVIEYHHNSPNCRAINNCGPGDNGPNCPAARNVPNEPGLEAPTTYGGVSTATLNPITQGKQPFHAQMVHVTVTQVVLSE